MAFRLFLLSPANCRGRRARQLLSPRATFGLATALRSSLGVPIGELFAHMSGLYFRGKLTYARRFGQPPPDLDSGALVITPDRGLVTADAMVTHEVLSRFADAEISPENPGYRGPLEASARALLAVVGEDAEFVLLGSVASEKYVGVLGSILGSRLTFPSAFVGRGDMSRGGLLLRAAAAGQELPYVPLIGAVRRGPRPPKLAPERRHAVRRSGHQRSASQRRIRRSQ